MMSQNKKIAMLIVKSLSDGFKDDYKKDVPDQQVKTEKEHEESMDSREPSELAMKKFVDAVHDRDTLKACKAMSEFMELSEGSEYVDDSMYESKED